MNSNSSPPISIKRWGLSPFKSLTLFILLSLFALKSCNGLLSTHPLHDIVDKINKEGPFVALVMAYKTEVEALVASNAFVPRSGVLKIELYGREFHVGRIKEVDVIYVLSGQRRLNAGITVQVLLDVFDIRGIVHYGIAGSANDSLSFGDVSIPRLVAFTGSWTWTKYKDSTENTNPELSFGEYNIPVKGNNHLSTIVFKPEEYFSMNKPMEEVFWFEVDNSWFRLAKKLKIELKRCINETYCLPKAPQVVSGLKASSADIFLDNAAYREFLFNEFGVSTVDEESSAIVMTAKSIGVPVIVIRGISDLAGGEAKWSSTTLNDVASINALNVALEFIGALGKCHK